jgi:hypothetical protein
VRLIVANIFAMQYSCNTLPTITDMMIVTKVLFLLLLHSSVKADDGCTDEFSWKCGDVCIDARQLSNCLCGNTAIAARGGTWCCATGCTTQGYGRNGTCSTGTVLPLTQSCDGVCNHHPEDIRRNYVGVRSHVPVECDNMTRCLPEQVCHKWNTLNECVAPAPALCTGAPPVCRDGQDIHTCPACDIRHHHRVEYPYQCKSGTCASVDNSGAYDCPHRDDNEESDGEGTKESVGDGTKESDDEGTKESDYHDYYYGDYEVDLTEQTSGQAPDFQPCETVSVDRDFAEKVAGVMCGGDCAQLYFFCDPDDAPHWFDNCPDLYEARANVCSNHTFLNPSRELLDQQDTPGWAICGGTWAGQIVYSGE